MWASGGNVRLVFALAAIPALVAVVLLAIGVDEPQGLAKAQPRKPVEWGELAHLGRAYWVLAGLSALFSLARFSEAFLVLRGQTDGLSPALAPAVMIVMNIVYALIASPAGALSDRMDKRVMLALGLGCLVAADLVLAYGQGLVPLMIGVSLWGLHMGLTQGVFAAMIANAAPAHLRGTAFGLYNLVSGLSLLLASVFAGALWSTLGPAATFLAGAVISLVTMAGLAAIRPIRT
jgi:MFS family permease